VAFWRKLGSEFEAVAENYLCPNAVLQFLYKTDDDDERWIILDAAEEAAVQLELLAKKAVQRLDDVSPASPASTLDAWARHLANNDHLHRFAYGRWNLKDIKPKIDLEYGTVDFEAYLRRQRFAIIEESMALCRRNQFAAQGDLDKQHAQTEQTEELISGGSSIPPPYEHPMATAEREANGMPPNRDTVTNERRLLYQELRRRCKEAKQPVNHGILANRADSAWNDRTWVKRWTQWDSRVTAAHDRKIRRAIRQWLMELEEKSPKSPQSPYS